MDKVITADNVHVIRPKKNEPRDYRDFLATMLIEPTMSDFQDLLHLGFNERDARTMTDLMGNILVTYYDRVIKDTFMETLNAQCFYLGNILTRIEEVVNYGAKGDKWRAKYFMSWATKSLESGFNQLLITLENDGVIERCECCDGDFSLTSYANKMNVQICPECQNLGYHKPKGEVNTNAKTNK